MTQHVSAKLASWVLRELRTSVEGIFKADFIAEGIIKRSDLHRPRQESIERLMSEAIQTRRAHERYAERARHKQAADSPNVTDWVAQAKSYLFRSKRAGSLASLLKIGRDLQASGLVRPSKAGLEAVLKSAQGRDAIASLLRHMKARHVGIDMLDITVCGALPPYTHILGGKLVALLMVSPEIVTAYSKRYKGAVSVIASSMKGQPVSREPRLVLMSTTSLYGVSSSQYNRLRIPKTILGEDAVQDLEYKLLGKSLGFGSYHFSRTTVRSMELLARCRRNGRRVNSIFGEGVSPKLRKLREALDEAGLPSNALLQHGSPRLVYGVALASNFREVLLELEKRPTYLLRTPIPAAGTKAIVNYWFERWLSRRIASPEVLHQVAAHVLVRPVIHGARVRRGGEEVGLPLFE